MIPPTRIDPTPSFWDEEPLSEAEMADAIRSMHDLLIKKFASNDLNCMSPVCLGRHLMSACWHRDKMKVPPAPQEVRDLLKATSPQGRHEILTPLGLQSIPALYEYDMRLAYLWCCKELPYGKVSGNPRDAHKVEVGWEAPDGWDHIGILPMRRQGWEYPLAGRGWVDRREWYTAKLRGWTLEGYQCLKWEKEGALDRWSDGILWALRQVPRGGLIYRMIRRTALHTIGSLHRTSSSTEKTGSTPPAGNPSTRFDPETGTYSWTEESPIQGRGIIYMHPEWTTTIWARCRSKVTSMAFLVPRQFLVAIKQDAIYTSIPVSRWDDHSEGEFVGMIRRKWCREGEMLAPHTMEDLDRLRRWEG